MRLMFYQWEYPPRGWGIGRYAGHMARALADAGHDVFVVTSRGAGLPDEEPLGAGGRIYRVFDEKDTGLEGPARAALEIARRHGVEIIEAPDHLGEAAALLKVRDRPRVIVKTHYNDVFPAARYAQAFYAWQKPLIDIACLRQRARIARERFSIEHADAVIAPTRRILDELRAAGIRLPARIEVIPNPIPPMPAEPVSETPTPTILLVGRLDIGKGIAHLPGLLDAILPRFPQATLEIAGGDSYARFLGSMEAWLMRRLGSRADHVRFLGRLDAGGVDAAYRRACVVVVPSRWDTFPTAVLEAMARGKAIVASPHGGMPEMLADTEAVVADPSAPAFADAVAGFLGDSARRRAAGESARRRAETVYAPARVAGQYAQWLGEFR